MADATRAAVGHTRISSGNLLIADAVGEAIDLEAVPGDFGYLLPKNGVIIHSNHFFSNVQVFDKKKGSSTLTLLRPKRLWHLLERSVNLKDVTVEDLQSVFRDHYSYPNGICRHIDNKDPVNDRVCTVFSTIVDLEC